MGLFGQRLASVDLASLRSAVGGRVRVIAWGRTQDGPVVGLADRLAIGSRSGGTQEWAFVAWEQIDRGGWDPATGELRWSGVGLSGRVVLSEPGRLPEFFRERVEASILLERVLSLGGGQMVTISARRNPGAKAAALSWQVKPALEELGEEARRHVEAELARVRAEYDIAGSIW